VIDIMEISFDFNEVRGSESLCLLYYIIVFGHIPVDKRKKNTFKTGRENRNNFAKLP
jgi:hypothetical protein